MYFMIIYYERYTHSTHSLK